MEDKKTELKILRTKLHRPEISDELTQANEALRREINERKQIQEELEQVKENLARAQEIAHIGSWQLDIAKNKLWWSDETYRIFGVANGTPMTYEKFLAYVHPEHKTGVEEPWLAALKGKPYDIEHRIIVADKVKWVRERAEVTFDEAGNAVSAIGTVQDITERKKAEDEIKKSEKRFRDIADNAKYFKNISTTYSTPTTKKK
jgi:PAS domain S-box-containing protein